MQNQSDNFGKCISTAGTFQDLAHFGGLFQRGENFTKENLFLVGRKKYEKAEMKHMGDIVDSPAILISFLES